VSGNFDLPTSFQTVINISLTYKTEILIVQPWISNILSKCWYLNQSRWQCPPQVRC